MVGIEPVRSAKKAGELKVGVIRNSVSEARRCDLQPSVALQGCGLMPSNKVVIRGLIENRHRC